MLKFSTAAICLVTLAGAWSFPALAQEPAQEVVQYTDLDLRTAVGVESLDSRINSAARKVCRKVNSGGPLEIYLMRNCRKDTLARVWPVRNEVIESMRRRDGIVEIVSLSVTANSKP